MCCRSLWVFDVESCGDRNVGQDRESQRTDAATNMAVVGPRGNNHDEAPHAGADRLPCLVVKFRLSLLRKIGFFGTRTGSNEVRP